MPSQSRKVQWLLYVVVVINTMLFFCLRGAVVELFHARYILL